MRIQKSITNYLADNGWRIVYKGDVLIHYQKLKDETINHLYVTYFPDRNEYEVELGFGENQSNSKMYKLRNIVSILKKQGL